VLAKVLHNAEQLQLAVQLDPQHLTRTIKAQQCVHMFNVYSEQAAFSLTYLHQVRLRSPERNQFHSLPPLGTLQCLFSANANVTGQLQHMMCGMTAGQFCLC
jgi:hypothetical protein